MKKVFYIYGIKNKSLKVMTTEEKIIQHLEDNGQKLLWLAKTIGISVGHLHHVLKGVGITKRPLTEYNRQKINQTLKTNY